MRIGVVSNPLSRRNRKLLPAVEALLEPLGHVVYERLDDFGDLLPALQRLADRAIEVLVISGGDGTVSAALTGIVEGGIFAEAPAIAILPGGTSNTIAADVGLHGEPLAALSRLVQLTVVPPIESRSLIRVEYDRTKPAVCGMFFGTAAVCDAIALRRRLFPQRWLPDPIAAALTLGYVLGGAALGREGVLSGQRIRLNLGGNEVPARQYVLVIATTLSKIVLGGSPFWGPVDGPLKCTTIASPARQLIRNVYRLLYGSDRERLPASVYHSAAVERIELSMDCAFNLDGEFFHPGSDDPVVLTTTPPVRFVQL